MSFQIHLTSSLPLRWHLEDFVGFRKVTAHLTAADTESEASALVNLCVILTQAKFVWEERLLIEKVPHLDCPVGVSVGCFLD